ncbi:binding-protein-dependent transport systems inner membrane component [Catenulispora acidiphila DSM 44928]|uniref:Binding-protein-dependent transport systems inner membrane component n=1 Tax=Catenulispora acidiphila (strain DSM 44928 / JCM 14897 / NBRC 102108 / NRRL B-24433 / ID139908) TaxID=479433 RepID=C7Q361_CATAD|nr:ABC transporter permease subunit [Catenulispora acidiphila]ACU73797.1 binding-protein-dependent transport systems inner membrane component [Catenulispora acidiphila DSM 44928]
MAVMADGAAVPEEARPRPEAPPGRRENAGPAPARPARGLSRWARLRRDRSLLLMIAPAMLVLLVFAYLPMFGTISAFEYYDPIYGFFHSNWVGLKNFTDLMADPAFWHAFENTLVLSLVSLVLYFPIPVALALLLNTVISTKLRSFIQAVVYLPHFFSWVLVITVFNQMLGGAGLLNQFLRQHHMATWNIMSSGSAFKYLVTFESVWKEAGWGIIVFLAALAAIDPALYESAAVDGASRWRRMWHITLPGMRGMIVLMLVLRLGNALNVGFEQMLIQRQAVGAQHAEVLDTFAYFYGIGNGNFGYGAAAGLFKGIISLILIFAANKMAHKFGEDGLYRK